MRNVVTRATRCKMQQFLTESCNFAWLLVGYSLGTCSCSMVTWHPIKEDTDLQKNTGVLLEK